VDAISADGRSALTVIAFVGSVFSPYYAAARRRAGPADPLNHVCINAILYTPRGKFWAMTERGAGSLTRAAERLWIGPSGLTLTGSRLTVDIDEWTVPIPRRLHGRITVDLGPVFQQTHLLDAQGQHAWRPVAPHAAVEVAFDRPEVAWSGPGYVDMNHGAVPLEGTFANWNWSREDRGDTTRILYDTIEHDGGRRSLALDYGRDGRIEAVEPEPMQVLPKTLWRVARATRPGRGQQVRVERTLEDTPFYSRSLLVSGGAGSRRTMHESVDLGRFASPIVQAMLPFRMPRRGR
jgi:carotenoid 1,2-hydratase